MKKFWLMSNNVYDFCVPFYLIPIKNWCYIRNLSLATINSNSNVKKKCSLLTNVREKIHTYSAFTVLRSEIATINSISNVEKINVLY